MNQKPKICTNCILPETFPGISFNDKGVCIHCQNYRGEKATAAIKTQYENKFLDLINQYKPSASASLRETEKNNTNPNPSAPLREPSCTYDVLMAYSGGKDSTYTLDLFVNRYKLRVLALTFDNTFISPQSFINMTTVCDQLGADHLIIRPNKQLLHNIFRTAAKEELYSVKTLERASTICTSCIGLVKSIILRTAIEKEIPFVGFGWSPGQAPVQSSVMRTNAALMKMTQKAVYEPLHRIAGDAIRPYFVTDDQFNQPDKFPWNIHPLAFLDYNEEKIVERNNEIGWIKPDDTDPNSTNCLLNAFANQVHREKYGFHPYVWEIANMVRAGVMDRQEGMEKIYSPESQDMIEAARANLGDA